VPAGDGEPAASPDPVQPDLTIQRSLRDQGHHLQVVPLSRGTGKGPYDRGTLLPQDGFSCVLTDYPPARWRHSQAVRHGFAKP
jgi:hypothetical protein